MAPPIQKAAVLGASGDLGSCIVPALLQAGFNVVAIGRPGGRQVSFSTDVEQKAVPFDDELALTKAFEGVDAVVEAINPAALLHQRIIVRATLAAGVKHLITNEFGADNFHPNAVHLPITELKRQAQQDTEDEISKHRTERGSCPLTWTGIITSVWYDFVMRAGFFWLNPKTRTITRYGSGDQKVSLSRIDTNAQAVLEVLRHPDKYRNRPVYIADHAVSTNQLIAMVSGMESSHKAPWTIVDRPNVTEIERVGRAMWDADTEAGITDRLHSRAWVQLVLAAMFDEENTYGACFDEKAELEWQRSDDELLLHLEQLVHEIE